MADEGLTEGAILLLTLGEEEASEVFKHLSPREVQKLGETMASLTNLTRDQVDKVLDRFHNEASAQASLDVDTDAYLRNVLSKALGPDKANLLLDRILSGGDTSAIERLKWLDAPTVAEMIKNEHPQIIATILVHLERDQASQVLGALTARTRNDVALRIATLDGVQPAALRELNEAMSKLFAGSDQLSRKPLGGVRMVAEILNMLPGSVENETVESVREVDADLAQKILDEMLKFEDLQKLDDKAIQSVLREVQGDSLVIALKGADTALRDRIFKNMSQRAAEQMREDLETKGPVKLSEVEAQQKEVIKIVRRLAEEGQIAIGGKGDDQFV